MRCADPGLVEVIEELHGDEDFVLLPAHQSYELDAAIVGSWSMSQVLWVSQDSGHMVQAEHQIARMPPRDVLDACHRNSCQALPPDQAAWQQQAGRDEAGREGVSIALLHALSCGGQAPAR